MILSLLKEGVSGDAFGRLMAVAHPQKPVVDSESFGFVLGFHEQVKRKTVVNRRAVRLIHPRVQIAERLRGFLMLRHLVDHRQIRLDRVLDAVLLEEALGAIQMLAYVCGHPFRLPLRCLKIVNPVLKRCQTSTKQVLVPVCTLRGARTALVNYIPPARCGKTLEIRRCGKHHRNPPPQISAAASLCRDAAPLRPYAHRRRIENAFAGYHYSPNFTPGCRAAFSGAAT